MRYTASQPRLLASIQELNLEFAAGVTDALLLPLRGAGLEALNLNGCQKCAAPAGAPPAACRRAARRPARRCEPVPPEPRGQQRYTSPACSQARSLPAALVHVSSARPPAPARVTNAAVAALAGPPLRRLELYWNLNVTDELLEALSARCTRLEALNLSGCKGVGDAGVAAVARACAALTHVDLTRCVVMCVQIRPRCLHRLLATIPCCRSRPLVAALRLISLNSESHPGADAEGARRESVSKVRKHDQQCTALRGPVSRPSSVISTARTLWVHLFYIYACSFGV